MLHMDLFGPTSVRSINHKTFCLIVTDDFSRFSWVFFLASKDETTGILNRFITEIENQLNHKVKVIRCDNGTEFKNREMNEFCGLKGIKREFSVARTPQQNGVTKRKNRTLIEAARTIADSLLPTVFWAEAVNTAYKYDGTRKKAQSIQMLVEKSLKPQCNMGALQRGKTTKSSSTNNFNTFSTPVSFCYRLLMMKLWTLRILLLLIKLWVQRLISTTWNLQLLSVPTSITKYSLIILKIKYLEIQARTNPQNRSSPEMKVGLSNARRSALFLDSEVGTLVDLPYGKSQPLGFVDLEFPEKVYKVEKALYGLHQAPRACKQKEDGIFISQDKYVGEILKKLLTNIRTANTPMETNKALTKDEDGEDVDVHSYRLRVANSTTEAEILLLLNSVVKCFGSKINGRLMVYKCSELYTSANWIEVGRKRKTQKRRRTTKDTTLPQTSVPQDLRADEAVHKGGGVTVWKGRSPTVAT
ncbi:putative ribonuclease H-like domain-containing protein [Tanacetum coccineum]